MFDMFMTAFSSACSLEALVANFIGVALGIVLGALPGLTAVMGVARSPRPRCANRCDLCDMKGRCAFSQP